MCVVKGYVIVRCLLICLEGVRTKSPDFSGHDLMNGKPLFTTPTVNEHPFIASSSAQGRVTPLKIHCI